MLQYFGVYDLFLFFLPAFLLQTKVIFRLKKNNPVIKVNVSQHLSCYILKIKLCVSIFNLLRTINIKSIFIYINF